MPTATVAEANVGLLRRHLARPVESASAEAPTVGSPGVGSRPVPLPWSGSPAPGSVYRALAGRSEPLVAHGEAGVVARTLRRELRALSPELPGVARGWIREVSFLVRLFSTIVQDPTPCVLVTADPGKATAPPEEGDDPWALSLTAWFAEDHEGTSRGVALLHRGSPTREDLVGMPGCMEGPGQDGEGKRNRPRSLLLRVATTRRPFFLDDPAALDVDRLPRIEGPVDVLLVSMPFAYLQHPSIALSLLKQTLPEELRTEVLYFTFAFAEIVGPAFYDWIASGKPSPTLLLGEWIFGGGLTDSADGSPADGRSYFDEVLGRGEPAGAVPEAGLPWLRWMRSEASGFLDRAAERVLAARPRLVGVTSVFQQHVAALGLARRLKMHRPDLAVVLGGANCEGVMGRATLRRFGFIDAVVSGEGERIFPELVERLLTGFPVTDLPGVSTRESVDGSDNRLRERNAPAVERMDDLPCPDYEDHFRQWRHSSLGEDYAPRPLFETARGCWWGEKHHCTFCGLNGSGMAFRSKSPGRVLAELEDLIARHPGSSLAVVDNILDMRYLRTLIPELALRLPGLELFYEVKANLKKDHLRLLRDAGIREIQPGIESLSTEVLRLMRKGVSGLQNLQLLKWCKELGVRPFWNFLWGFAGEPPAEYERMEALIPWLSHLQPPEAIGAHRLDRFSPNFFDGERLGYRDITPYPAYRHVYGQTGERPGDLTDLAYYFQYRYRDGREPESYVSGLRHRLEEWQEVHQRSDLVAFDRDGRLLVFDYRPAAVEEVTVLSGLERELLLACDRVRSLGGLARSFSLGGDREVEQGLAALLDRGLLVREGGRVLALPVPAGSST